MPIRPCAAASPGYEPPPVTNSLAAADKNDGGSSLAFAEVARQICIECEWRSRRAIKDYSCADDGLTHSRNAVHDRSLCGVTIRRLRRSWDLSCNQDSS